MVFMPILWLVIFVLLVAAVVGAFRRQEAATETHETGERHPAGLAILEERYARGEINREEYLQRKHDILAA